MFSLFRIHPISFIDHGDVATRRGSLHLDGRFWNRSFQCMRPKRAFRTAFMAWHSRRPISASVHCCFSVISHGNQFHWCLLSNLRCRLSLFTRGSVLRLWTDLVHLYLCRTFCIFLTRSFAQFLHNLTCIFAEFAQILSILPIFVNIWPDPYIH